MSKTFTGNRALMIEEPLLFTGGGTTELILEGCQVPGENVLAHTGYRGVVTACGLAQGLDLPGSMLPFILRNVTLAGIDSVNAPQEARVEAWLRLARDLDLGKLARATQVVGLAEVPAVVSRIFEGKVRGRAVVDVNA